MLPRRGPTVAVIEAPRWPRQEVLRERQPRGLIPRGTPREGPERSAEEPWRNPRGGLCGGPGRSAKEPQTPSKSTTQNTTNGGKVTKGEAKAREKPTIITVEENGRERKWGPLSRANAWRAGTFWEDMDREVKVFIVEEDKRKEVDVEKRLEGGRERFWFRENVSQPQEHRGGDDNQTPEHENSPRMDEVDPEETRREQMTSLAERIASLERENEEKERTIKEMEMKVVLLERAAQENAEKHAAVEKAFTEIAQHVEGQATFNESSKRAIACLENQVKIHQDNIHEVVRILQAHEQFIVDTGSITQGIARNVIELAKDNEKNRAWIGELMRESQAQTQVLRQHEMGQQALAGVIRVMMTQQPQHQPQQTVTGSGPTVTEVDDDNGVLNFTGCPSPQTGPPDIGSLKMTIKPPRAPKRKDDRKQN